MKLHPSLYLGVVAIERGAFGLHSIRVANFPQFFFRICTLKSIYIYIYTFEGACVFAVCISHNVNTLGEKMNPTILLQSGARL